ADWTSATSKGEIPLEIPAITMVASLRQMAKNKLEPQPFASLSTRTNVHSLDLSSSC
ncbi:16458_t:CDS:1, partial [Acaulospora colombiana]